jgi:hypothetical protein
VANASLSQMFGMKLDRRTVELLQKKLSRFRNRNTLWRRAVRESADKSFRPVAKVVKSNAPVETGLLRRSIRVKTKTMKDGTVWTGIFPDSRLKVPVSTNEKGRLISLTTKRQREKYKAARTRNGNVIYRRPAKYVHLVELGTRKGVRGTHFMRHSFDSRKHAVLRDFIRHISESVIRLAAKGKR